MRKSAPEIGNEPHQPEDMIQIEPWVLEPYSASDEFGKMKSLNMAVELYAQLKGESFLGTREQSIRKSIQETWKVRCDELNHNFWVQLEVDLHNALAGDPAAAQRALNLTLD